MCVRDEASLNHRGHVDNSELGGSGGESLHNYSTCAVKKLCLVDSGAHPHIPILSLSLTPISLAHYRTSYTRFLAYQETFY